MDSDLTLRIEHEASTSELVVPTPVAIDEDDVTLVQIAIDERLDDIDRAEATVFRDEWLNVLDVLDQRNDEAFIETDDGTAIFGGRVDDWQFDGVTVSVMLDSFEVDAKNAEPPASFSRSEDPDDSIATDIVTAMPDSLSVGTIEQTTVSISLSGTHQTYASLLRELAGSTGAEIAYQPLGSVDYVDRLGVDRTEVLSPASGAVISEPRIRRATGQDKTDVRVVSQSDGTIFEEAEAVATDPGELQSWRVERINSTASSRLQARATRVANEIANAPEYLEVETTIDPLALDTDPALGDRYPVELPAYGVDADLRIVEFDRRIRDDGETARVRLANRLSTLAGQDGPFAI